MLKITDEMLEAGRSLNGGWSKEQVELLGVAWPLQRGWKRGMIGSSIEEEALSKFLRLKDAHLKATTLERLGSDILKGKQPPKRAELADFIERHGNGDGSGSFTHTCTATACTYPECKCITR